MSPWRVSDLLADGRRIRVLNVLDDFSRRSLATEVDSSLPDLRVCRVLDRLVWHHGKPEPLLVDNGPEFTGKALDEWASAVSASISSLLENPPKTHMSKASTLASCATSDSTNTGLPAWPMPAASPHGVWTTTPYDHTAHCKISPRSSLPSNSGKTLHYIKNLSCRLVHNRGAGHTFLAKVCVM